MLVSSGVICTTARFDISFGNIFLKYMRIIWGSVIVAGWPPFGILLLPQCILSICCFSYFPFWFRGQELGYGCLCSLHYPLCLL